MTAHTVVISPHLDDAVLSVGQYLAMNPGCVVVTVFAGYPEPGTTSAYDQRCGFGDAQQAVTQRRDEDLLGLAMLGASGIHLDFVDSQYRQPSSDQEIADRLADVVEDLRPETVLGPVGLIHADHRQVGRVWPGALAGVPDAVAVAYEELPYRVTFPARCADATRRYGERHRAVSLAADLKGRGRKAQAMLAYRSQLLELDPLACLVPERLWRLRTR